MSLSAERYDEIMAGITKIKAEKPYRDRADAVAALDWIAAASADLHRAQKKLAPAEILEITRFAADIDELDNLSQAIRTRLAANDQTLPSRHGGTSSDELNLDG